MQNFMQLFYIIFMEVPMQYQDGDLHFDNETFMENHYVSTDVVL